MSSIFKQLTDDDLKADRSRSQNSYEEIASIAQPRLTGIKFSIFIAFILSALALAGAGYLYQALNAERRERQAIEANQIQLQGLTEKFQQQTEEYHAEYQKIQGDIQKVMSERNSLENTLVKLRNHSRELKKKLVDMNQEMRAQAAMLAQPGIVGGTGADEFAGEEGVPFPQPFEFKENRTQSAAPTAPVQQVAGTPQVKPEMEVVQPPFQKRPSTLSPLKKVLTVNRKFNFVVVNLGIQDQVKMGDRLVIERQGTPIATVEIEKLYDNFSAATIIRESKDAPITEGDGVANPHVV